jgi:hypothetical protein
LTGKGFWALSKRGLADARCCLSSIEDPALNTPHELCASSSANWAW